MTVSCHGKPSIRMIVSVTHFVQSRFRSRYPPRFQIKHSAPSTPKCPDFQEIGNVSGVTLFAGDSAISAGDLHRIHVGHRSNGGQNRPGGCEDRRVRQSLQQKMPIQLAEHGPGLIIGVYFALARQYLDGRFWLYGGIKSHL